MAFEHGSIDLGIRNPFKPEGAIRSVRGLITALLGGYLLIQVPALVKVDMAQGWVTAGLAILVLGWGLGLIGTGTLQLMRFFVGRNAPASLAINHSPSAKNESGYIKYTADILEGMLTGRKNTTFDEPIGWVARLIHTLFPRLLFLPRPIRNLAQKMADALIKTIVAILCFALAWFVAASGLIGGAGDFVISVFSLLLLLYLLMVWTVAGQPINRNVDRTIESTSSAGLAAVIALSVLLPVGLGFLYANFLANTPQGHSFTLLWDAIGVEWHIALVAVLMIVSGGIVAALLASRSMTARPTTEVSETRSVWQESVHPQEIFVNLDNIVMANRRYKEVPNRIYRALDPMLKDQSEGKGSFEGKLLQETQPVCLAQDKAALFKVLRLVGTALGHFLLIAATFLLVIRAQGIVELQGLFANTDNIAAWAEPLGTFSTALFLILILYVFGRLLVNLTHVFWAEIQFTSVLIYFKCEGTYTESKLSTGMSIFDSTRSENQVVRANITNWVVLSQLTTSTFAATGARNLEFPRYILEMQPNDGELSAIISDLKGFLSSRASIASMGEKDLAATSDLYQVNSQTRGLNNSPGIADGRPVANGDAAISQHQWYLHINGQTYGPYPGDALKAYIAEGRVERSTHVNRIGTDGWVEAGADEILAGLFPARIAPPPPPPLPPQDAEPGLG